MRSHNYSASDACSSAADSLSTAPERTSTVVWQLSSGHRRRQQHRHAPRLAVRSRVELRKQKAWIRVCCSQLSSQDEL